MSPRSLVPSVALGSYLGMRLRQLGVEHVFGLPGDFNLALLDEMLTSGVTWVGTTNELNAAYAADGYARMRRGPAALVTTFGVGELSAINGIAGSYAEDVPVISIVGAPATHLQNARTILHHSLGDGDYGRFTRAFAEVTAASVQLTSADTGVIDRLLIEALSKSKPVHLVIPADLAVAPVDPGPLSRPLRGRVSDPAALADFEEAVTAAIEGLETVTLLVGPQAHRCAGEHRVRRIAGYEGVGVATQLSSRALLDDSHPASLGTYGGATFTADAETLRRVDTADPLVMVGTLSSDFLTGFFSEGFDRDGAISLEMSEARVGAHRFYDVHLDDALAVVERAVARTRALRPRTEAATITTGIRPADGQELTHATLWPLIEAWLQPDTTVLAEAGTAYYGAVTMPMPDGCDLLGQPVWSSIGYTLPAMLGAQLAQPDRSAVLLIGDGAAQLTAGELGAVLTRPGAPTVILINNDGYTIERAIRSPDAPYQDIPSWDWTALPAALGADKTFTATARTTAELYDALVAARDSAAASLVEVVLPRDDTPPLLQELAERTR